MRPTLLPLATVAMMSVTIRDAGPDDAGLIFGFIVELAVYEREPEAVVTSEQVIRGQLLSDEPPFECVIAEANGVAVGFALFFHTYSTWRGTQGLFLEDLFVPEAQRGNGYGGALLRHLARLAVDRNCGRFEWTVLDWNTPAIGFYESVGAVGMDEWTRFRLDGDALTAFAAG